MQVNIGEKIRELRKRDGRKQEDLANALGVTSQAVSRWEAGGGYPDMNMIPAIANYFHITIDELFGYNNDRNLKIREYCDKAQKMLSSDLVQKDEQNLTDCVALLRKGLEEFPEEPELKKLLAAALNGQGWMHKGETPNEFWEEAAKLYEELLETDPYVIEALLSIYMELGEPKKAIAKASEQPSIHTCREVLLGNLYNIEDEEKYHGEKILALIHHLRIAIDWAIATNDELSNSREGMEILLAELELFKRILGDDCLGYHSEFCFTYMQLVEIAGKIGDYEAVVDYFDAAFGHYTKFNEEWGRAVKSYTKVVDESCFTTTILKSVKKMTGEVHFVEARFLKHVIADFPEDVKKKITTNEKYEELFKM